VQNNINTQTGAGICFSLFWGNLWHPRFNLQLPGPKRLIAQLIDWFQFPCPTHSTM